MQNNKNTSGSLQYSTPPSEGFRFEEYVRLGDCNIARGVSFGMYSYMNSGMVRSEVVIGRYCSIGRNVTIGSGAHDYNALSTSPFFVTNSNKNILKWADPVRRIRVLIEDDVWIGDNVFILNGVTIGTGTVIGASSVVTKSVPPYSIIVGIPAKIIRYRFPNEIIQRLYNLRWAEFDSNILKNIDVGDIDSSLAFLESLPNEARVHKEKKYNVFFHNS